MVFLDSTLGRCFLDFSMGVLSMVINLGPEDRSQGVIYPPFLSYSSSSMLKNDLLKNLLELIIINIIEYND